MQSLQFAERLPGYTIESGANRIGVQKKALTNLGLQAAGLHAGMLLNGAVSSIAHSSLDAEDAADLFESRMAGDMRTFLKRRDEPFYPEPGGPRSKPRD